jgi:outer membrane immunogenic protein
MTLSSTAVLADGMPSRAPRAVVEAPFSWTGFYGGGNIGGVIMKDDPFTSVPADAGTAAFWGPCFAANTCPRNRPSETGSGVIGGLQLGYNLQFGSFLAGVEADIQGSNAGANRSLFQSNTGTGFAPFNGAANTNLEWLGTARGRLGLLATPTFLVYATGGFAFAHLERSLGGFFDPNSAAPAAHYGRSTSDVTGWTAGGGLEMAVTNRVTIGAEYLFVSLDAADNFRATSPGNFPGGCTPTNCNFNVHSGDLDLHIIRAKVNFKF